MIDSMEIKEIMEHLPHRYPFLLVDRVVSMELGKRIHAYKNVSFNEPHFTGHFPHHPVMPGVLIMEALAQAAGIDWNELRELWLADPRINRSHTYVYPDNRGWGGKCLPKDTANLCAWARSAGVPASLIEMVRAYNDWLRGQM